MDFPATRWTLIASLTDPAETGAALDDLCGAYWPPIYAYILRSGRPHAEAQDLTQDFLEMVVRRQLLERANPREGRLRNWLMAALRHFMANVRRHESRQKRGAGELPLPMDHEQVVAELDTLASESATPAEAFDRAWVSALLRGVLGTLRGQYRQAGQEEEFAALLPWLLESGSVPQIEAAAASGMTVANFRVRLHRLRGRYKEALWQAIASTLEREEEYQDELSYLFRIMGRKG